MPAVLIDYEQGKLSGTSGEAIIQGNYFVQRINQR